MGLSKNADALGAPDLTIAGLQIWVHGRERIDSQEPVDADWLRVTAHCGAAGASVWAGGAFLTASGFGRFGEECQHLYTNLNGNASLLSDEPNLVATLAAVDRHGHVAVTVAITPDQRTQTHKFRFELDQTYVFDIARQVDAIVERFPNPHAAK
jgi:hypothetical protein